MLHAFAPAKINLYLHITGKRADGYHLLDSLVAFTNIGDTLKLEHADSFSFVLDGPMASALEKAPSTGNLAVRAAMAFAEAVAKPLNVRLTLTKKLPIASGIGGGSSDAAATLRLLAELWHVAPTDPLLAKIASSLGQDVPCCIPAATCYFRDVGDVTDPGPKLPHTNIVLVNPNKALPTPDVYKARRGGFAPPARLDRAPRNASDLALMLQERGNGLTEAACDLMPEIRLILAALGQTPDCLLARMSGSGATCFGLFPNRSAARRAASIILAAHPDWWVVPGFVPNKNTNTTD